MACQPGRPPTVAQKDAAAGGEQPPGRNIVNSGNPRFFFLMKTLEPGLQWVVEQRVENAA
jgi:hypothetical protein